MFPLGAGGVATHLINPRQRPLSHTSIDFHTAKAAASFVLGRLLLGSAFKKEPLFFQFSSMGERGKALKYLGEGFGFQVLLSTNVFLKIFTTGVWFLTVLIVLLPIL